MNMRNIVAIQITLAIISLCIGGGILWFVIWVVIQILKHFGIIG